MADKWSQYVPFNKGDHLDIDGPWNYDGEGEIVDLNEGVLEFGIHLPAVHVFFKAVPEMTIRFRIDYAKEGDGNHADATINGKEVKDENVIVQSGPDSRLIQSSVLVQGKPLVVHIHRDVDRMDLKIQGYKFSAWRKALFQA